MNNIDLTKIKNIYFLGIGGIGVSAIARMFKSEGKDVSGIDASDSVIIEGLRKEGIEVLIGSNSSSVPPGTDLAVYTRALEVADAHILEEVKSTGVQVMSYPEVLNKVSSDKYTIAVSGMHGKTTTTAMCSHIWSDLGKSPTTIVGSIMKETGSNYLHGESEYFIVEADEYRRSFLHLSPKILIITNIEEDHLDYYKDLEDIKDAFHVLAQKVPKDGYIICDNEDEIVASVIKDTQATVVDYKKYMTDIPTLLTKGEFNRKNAACAVAAAVCCGMDKEEAFKSIATFRGTWRRFEYIGETEKGAKVYDDYAHHPTEIKSTLNMIKEEFPDKKVYIAFHPHLYSRTKLLFEGFAESLTDPFFEVVLLPIYPAREEFDPSITSEMLAEEIEKKGGNARVIDTFSEIEAYFASILGPNDILVTMGAGESNKIAYNLAK